MVSAVFTINGSSSPQTVTSGSTVTLALVSTIGVERVDWVFHGKFPGDLVYPEFIKSGSPSGATATFVVPSDPTSYGIALGITCTINSGKIAGVSSADAIAKGKVSVEDDTGVNPVGFYGETSEESNTEGWIGRINRQLTFIRRSL